MTYPRDLLVTGWIATRRRPPAYVRPTRVADPVLEKMGDVVVLP